MATNPLSSSALKPHPGLLVVDDHDLVRLGLRTLVETHNNASASAMRIFEARTLQEALVLFAEHQTQIDLVLLDLRLPDAHGFSGLTAFLTKFPRTRIVVLSGENDPSLAAKAVSTGAVAFLSKSADLRMLLDYIRPKNAEMEVLETQHDIPANPLARTVKTVDGTAVKLSARQSQAFDLLLSGHSNKEIAEKMHLSEGTVKNHISTLLLLFGVRSRAQLISQLR